MKLVDKKILFLLFILIFINKVSFAQKAKLKTSSVHLPVYYVHFFNKEVLSSNGLKYDIYYKKQVIPESTVNRDQVPLLYQHRKKNKFNGIFITTEDDFVAHFGVIMLRLNKDNTVFLNMVNNPALPTKFTSYKKIPNTTDSIYTLYDGYLLDAVWIKYTITEFLPAEERWREYYMKQVAGADGKSFNYYILKKVKSSKPLD